MVYAIIDPTQNMCVNLIEWDGTTPWTPPEGMVVQLHDGIAYIGGSVTMVNNSYVGIPRSAIPDVITKGQISA